MAGASAIGAAGAIDAVVMTAAGAGGNAAAGASTAGAVGTRAADLIERDAGAAAGVFGLSNCAAGTVAAGVVTGAGGGTAANGAAGTSAVGAADADLIERDAGVATGAFGLSA
jgi:hypothetical protein